MTSDIAALSNRDIRELVAALRSGSISPPYSPNCLDCVLDRGQSIGIADEFKRLAEIGFGPRQIAETLEFVMRDRIERPMVEDVVSLVMTRPQSDFAARDTGAVVRDLFASATTSVLVAGYAVYQGRQVFQSLADRMRELPELRVRLFLDVQRGQGDTSANDQIVSRFAYRFRESQWPSDRPLPEVYYDPRSLESGPTRSSLHAKCVVVDRRRLFISSANFTDAAQHRNIEIGVVIDSETISLRLTEFFESMMGEGALIRVPIA